MPDFKLRLFSKPGGVIGVSGGFLKVIQVSFSPEWILPGHRPIEMHRQRRIGFLPREIACTENLTPWKKVCVQKI